MKLLSILLASAGIAAAQSAPSFEVVSIKPHPGPITDSGESLHGATLTDRP